ncbi:hypothetical protein KIPB_015358, partial [Kipferlia bialata]
PSPYVKEVVAAVQPSCVIVDEPELILGGETKAKGKKGKKGKAKKGKGKGKTSAAGGDDMETPGASMTPGTYPATADEAFAPSRLKKDLASFITGLGKNDGIL